MFKVTKIPFLPHSDARLELQQAMPKCIELLPCDWLIYIFGLTIS